MRIDHVSHNGILLIQKYEGFESKPYLCPAKVPTIGYGATYYADGRRVKLTDNPITRQEAELLLDTMVRPFEIAVDSMTRDDITQGQFDALVSFAYNLGSKALQGSTLLKKVNTNPQDPTIRNEFNKWVNAGGKKLAGLVKRRTEEADLYFS